MKYKNNMLTDSEKQAALLIETENSYPTQLMPIQQEILKMITNQFTRNVRNIRVTDDNRDNPIQLNRILTESVESVKYELNNFLNNYIKY